MRYNDFCFGWYHRVIDEDNVSCVWIWLAEKLHRKTRNHPGATHSRRQQIGRNCWQYHRLRTTGRRLRLPHLPSSGPFSAEARRSININIDKKEYWGCIKFVAGKVASIASSGPGRAKCIVHRAPTDKRKHDAVYQPGTWQSPQQTSCKPGRSAYPLINDRQRGYIGTRAITSGAMEHRCGWQWSRHEINTLPPTRIDYLSPKLIARPRLHRSNDMR